MTGTTWFGLSVDNKIGQSFVTKAVVQYTKPTQLIVGSHAFGLLEVAERREIVPSFSEMMGFTPVRNVPTFVTSAS